MIDQIPMQEPMPEELWQLFTLIPRILKVQLLRRSQLLSGVEIGCCDQIALSARHSRLALGSLHPHITIIDRRHLRAIPATCIRLPANWSSIIQAGPSNIPTRFENMPVLLLALHSAHIQRQGFMVVYTCFGNLGNRLAC